MPSGDAVTGSTLASFLESALERIDGALDAWLQRPPQCPPLLSEAMRYSLLAGGKRLRPLLTLAAADAVARKVTDRTPASVAAAIEAALPAACAIEFLHTYSLIHDDLPAMDNDALRRGRPTAHVVYGDGIAILAGDGLQAAAFDLLAREPDTSDPVVTRRKLRVIGLLADAAGPNGMVGGQALDLQAACRVLRHTLTLDRDGLRDMHARKTGAIIRAAATAGAILAGGTDPLVMAVDRFAADVGLAFQIVDDILDVEGDATTLGKTAGKDAADAKPTYPALYGLERSRALAGDCIARCRATLEEAALTDGWLWPIATSVVDRRR